MTTFRKTFKPALGFNGRVLEHYQQRINLHNKLLQTIKSVLPERLARHALFCVSSAKKLILYTDSSVWSSQLRFYQRAIQDALITSQQHCYEVIQIKIIPTQTEPVNNLDINLPDSNNINLILRQAKDLNDVQLSTAMAKLGKTLEKLSRKRANNHR